MRWLAGLILALALISACTPSSSRYIPKEKYDELQNKLEFMQARLDKAEQELKDYESHRYSLFNSGVRKFRVDSITGETCIQLTSAGDWKRKDVQAQNCDCRDFIMGKKGEPNVKARKMLCGF